MKSISPKRLIAFASAISVSFFSLGQISNSPLLKETVVTANRVEQAVQDAIPATTLITQEQIQRSRALDLPSLLSQFTGIEIAQNGGMGTLSNVFLRGSESRHVLVLIDGIPLNNLNFNTVPLEALPLFSIDRIEIVRGNVSSLYGSSAMGGVINIFTKNTKKDWQQVQTQLGSFGYRSLQGGAGKSWDSGLAIAASAENAQNKGFNTINQAQRPGTNPDKDGFNLKATNVSLSQTLERGGVSLSLNELRMNTQFDSEFGPSSQADESKSILKNSAISGFLNPSKELTASLSLAQSSDDLNGFLSAFPFVVKSTKNVSTLGLVWKPNEINTITSGYESTNQKISSLSTKYGKTERDIHSARLGYHLNLNKHQIQLNTRQDQYSDFGNNNTGYGGYSYLITDQLRFLGSVSTGFMAPTFNDLYYPFGGNAKLIPETSRSKEIGIQYIDGSQSLRTSYFVNQYKNLIVNDSAFKRVNLNHTSNTGIETEYKYTLDDTFLRLSFTHQNPFDDDSQKRLVRRAKNYLQAHISKNVGLWLLDSNVKYTGNRVDQFKGSEKSLEAFYVLSFTASYQLTKQATVFGKIDNMTNQSYQTVYGYNQAGHNYLAGLRLSFL